MFTVLKIICHIKYITGFGKETVFEKIFESRDVDKRIRHKGTMIVWNQASTTG